MTAPVDALLAIVGTTLLIGAAALVAACLRLRSAIAYLLAGYLAANVIVVVVALGLSPWHALERRAFLAVLAVVFALSLVAWSLSGRPVPPWRDALATGRSCLRDRVVGPLAGLVAIAVAYVVAIAVLTPENEGDALAYHVARAAFWKQQRAVEYIPDAIEGRLNYNPPNSDIAQLFTMLASDSDRFVGLVQVVALLACTLGSIGIARRIGFSPRESMFGGLLFCTLPVVITQAWTALNDVAVAAFLVIAVYFVLERTRLDIVLAGVATGLAIGTKFTAVFSLPLLIAVVLASPRPGRFRALGGMVLIAALGGYWYVVNLWETGAADGGFAETASQHASHAPGDIALTAYRFLLGLLDLSGAPAYAWLWFVVAGLLVALAGALSRREGERLAPALVAAVVIVASPALVAITYRLLWNVRHDGALSDTPTFAAGATPSWFGPLGVLLAFTGVVVAFRQWRQRAAPMLAPLLAAMPLVFVGVLAVAITWDPWRGRFFIFPFALAASTWGLVLRSRGLTLAVVGIATTTVVLVLANAQSKPSGIHAFSGDHSPGIWNEPRWWIQSILRTGDDELGVLRFVETRIPPDASVALAPRGNEFLSPYFGAALTRRVELVLNGEAVSDRPGWLVAAPGVRPRLCAEDWLPRFQTGTGWLIAERTGSRTEC